MLERYFDYFGLITPLRVQFSTVARLMGSLRLHLKLLVTIPNICTLIGANVNYGDGGNDGDDDAYYSLTPRILCVSRLVEK